MNPSTLYVPHNCTYYLQGHCFREEKINPGFIESCRCKHLAGLMQQWDSFIDRADAFKLNEEKAFSLWEKRSSTRQIPQCKYSLLDEVRPALAIDIAQCEFLHDTACVLSIPLCSGICGDFLLKGMSSST